MQGSRGGPPVGARSLTTLPAATAGRLPLPRRPGGRHSAGSETRAEQGGTRGQKPARQTPPSLAPSGILAGRALNWMEGREDCGNRRWQSSGARNMSEGWFCKIGEKKIGPLSVQQLKTIAARGQLRAEHLVRRGDAGPWVPAGRVKGLFPEKPSAGEGQPAAAKPAQAKTVARAAPAPPASELPPSCRWAPAAATSTTWP